MTDERVRELIAEFDNSVPKSAGKVEFHMSYDDDPISVLANRAGYLRMARECLSAAIEPTKPNSYSISSDWKYLSISGSIPVAKLGRTENVDLKVPEPQKTSLEKAQGYMLGTGALALILFLICSTFVGCFDLLRRMAH
jgi:hypothetical protein